LKRQNHSPIELSLETLCEGEMPALSAYEGGSLAEAASVCLKANVHSSPVSLTVRGDYQCTSSLTFLEVTDQMCRTHGDPEVATERGACAIAILLVCALSEYTVVHRSYKETGVDYFLGDRNDSYFSTKRVSKCRVSAMGARRTSGAGKRSNWNRQKYPMSCRFRQ
jgi:hypothetical protein